MRLLIVDDYPGAAQAAHLYLQRLGHECRAAITGAGALEALSSFEPDVVLLDIGLPDLSGYDVARAIRERVTGKRVFIAALTGWASDADRAKALDAGIDMHLLKPLVPATLERLLAAAAERDS